MKEFETFAELEGSTQASVGKRLICRERANAEYIVQPAGYVALIGDVAFANGLVGELQLDNHALAEYFDSIQDGIDRLSSENGGTLYATGYYTITDTLNINGDNVTLKGAFAKNVFSGVVSVNDKGVIYADFTDGPAVLISDGGCAVDGMIVLGSPARRAATITTGAQNSNSGILIEGAADGVDIIQSVKVSNTRCIGHPADGLSIEGDITNLYVENFYSNDIGRHGLSISDGETGGRVNKSTPGIIYILKGKSFDCGGHGLAIGNPNSSQFPYRVTVVNREGYRLALDAAERYTTDANWVVVQDAEFINCAFGGTTTGNVADHSGLALGGRDIKLTGSRFINCDGAVYANIIQQSGFSTKNIEIDGAICNTTGSVDDFAAIANGADGVSILRVIHDCTNPVTDITYNSNNENITLHDIEVNKTVYANHEYDFTDAAVSGLKSGGGTLTISSATIDINKEGYYKVDTEGAAASDTLSTINTTLPAGAVIILRQGNSGRVVTLDHGAGNIRLMGALDYAFASASAFIQLMYDGTNFHQISPISNNAS